VKTQTNQIREGENYQPITKRWREVTTIAAAPATERMMMSPRRLKHHHLLLVGLHLDRRFGFGVKKGRRRWFFLRERLERLGGETN
jgi:hypothetical protein